MIYSYEKSAINIRVVYDKKKTNVTLELAVDYFS